MKTKRIRLDVTRWVLRGLTVEEIREVLDAALKEKDDLNDQVAGDYFAGQSYIA